MHPILDLISQPLGFVLERYGIVDPWTVLPASVQDLLVANAKIAFGDIGARRWRRSS